MRAEYENVINSHLGLQPVAINSSLVSAQNRLRLYWTNILTAKQLHISLAKQFSLQSLSPRIREYTFVMCLMMWLTLDIFFQGRTLRNWRNRLPMNLKTKSHYLRNDSWNCSEILIFAKLSHQHLHFVSVRRTGFQTILSVRLPEIERFPVSAIQNGKAIRDCSSKTNSTVIISGAIVSPQFGGGFRPILSGKAPCLLATSSNSAACLIINGDDMVLRRLTPKECCRLQTIPDWYEWVCSEPQIYKMLGNGWTVDVISHILQFL